MWPLGGLRFGSDCKSRTSGIRMLCSPSPLPSPSGRGSINWLLDFGFPSTRLSSFQNPSDPLLILQIPLHRFSNSFLKLMRRNPAQLILDFPRIDGITPIVSGSILDESD